MIDNIPVLTPPMPATPGMAPPSATPDANRSGSAANDIASSVSPAAPQASFAGVLQNRLKQMALNKTTSVPAQKPATTDKAAQPADPLASLADTRRLASVAGDAATEALNSVAANKKTEATEDEADGTAPPPLAAAPDPSTHIPLALNVPHAPAPALAPQPPPAPVATSGKEAAPAESDVTASSNPEPVPAAIVAATAEKTSQTPANPDLKSGEPSFAEALRAASPHAANPQQAPAAANVVPSHEVKTPFASAHWTGDVGNQLSWMVSQRESRADLVLNPPQLGRIEVSITMNGDQASASFVSVNPEVRDVLQGSLPRLREILADAGVSLGQANVGAESFANGGNGTEKGGKSPDDSFSSSTQSLLGSANAVLPVGSVQAAWRGQGLVDLFA